MRTHSDFSSRIKKSWALFGLLILAPSCGLLGSTDDEGGVFGLQDKGCLNSVGDQIKDYVDGKANMKKWSAGFQCTLDTLDLFHDFVRGTAPDEEYNSKDLHTLVTKILIQDKKIPVQLLADALKLKSSALGGSDVMLTRAELKKISTFIREFRDVTIEVYPAFQEMGKQPKAKTPLKISSAIRKISAVLAKHIDGKQGKPLTKATLRSLLKETSKVLDMEISDWTIDIFVGAKTLLVAGDDGAVQPQEWAKLIKQLSGLAGPFIGILWGGVDEIKPHAEVMRSYEILMNDFRSSLDQMIGAHGNAIPFAVLENMLDSVTLVEDDSSEDQRQKEIYKDVLHPVFEGILGSNTPGAIDTRVSQVLHQMATTLIRGEYHLDRLFTVSSMNPFSVSTQHFVSQATAYRDTVPLAERQEVTRLMDLAASFLPLFNPGERKIVLPFKDQNSLHNLRLLSAMRVAAMRLVDAYQKPEKPNHIDEETFVGFWDSLKWAAQLHKILDAENVRWPYKRFSEGDLFLPSSNGDKLLDRSEITYFLLFTLSTGQFKREMTEVIVPQCSCRNGTAMVDDGFGNLMPVTQACDGRYTGTRFRDHDQYLDPRKMDWMWPECFQKKHFENVPSLWNRAQVLLGAYNALDVPGKRELEIGLAETGRVEGYKGNTNPVGQSDMEGYAGIMHYVEFLYLRFDLDRNQILDGNEVLVAFPKFKKFLKDSDRIPGICANDTGCLEAVFTYIVEHGEEPGIFQLLGWLLKRNQWPDLVNARRPDIYRIVNQFAAK